MKYYHHGYGGNTKALVLLRPYLKKQSPYSNSIWLIASLSFFVLAFLIIFVHTRDSLVENSPSYPSSTHSLRRVLRRSSSATTRRRFATKHTTPSSPDDLPSETNDISSVKTIDTRTIDTLLYYASMSNETYRMKHEEMRKIVGVLTECSPPCNFLVFGLSPETLLWHALNQNGRTVFVDENRYYAAYFEEVHRISEVYDVVYTTRLADKDELLKELQGSEQGDDCRPVQNLLFTECKLGINDLPNHMYDIDWDVILVDGPSEAEPDDPGRMMPIFTAGVFARRKKGGGGKRITHVFLHDYYGDVEKVYGDEFLCRENLVDVSTSGMLAHFVVERMEEGDGVSSSQFCPGHRSDLTAAS